MIDAQRHVPALLIGWQALLLHGASLAVLGDAFGPRDGRRARLKSVESRRRPPVAGMTVISLTWSCTTNAGVRARRDEQWTGPAVLLERSAPVFLCR